MTDPKFDEFLENATNHLLAERHEQGHWEGELSTSALSTATAIVALFKVDPNKHYKLITAGSDWLIKYQNEDGGWGDTIRSFSNISTTLLCWSALQLCHDKDSPTIEKASTWIRKYVSSLDPDQIAEVVKARYGKDRTFSVPILMLCAICGTLGKNGWKKVLPLPYELAAFPRDWFAAMNLPVVSYALPALIAIGRARFEKHRPLPWSPFFWSRTLAWPKVSKLLHEIQPQSGGYLEAAPLTSFVTMALASVGKKDHPAVVNGVKFLVENVRSDGSWPIDTNLATWATTLSVKALSAKSVPCTVNQCTGYSRGTVRDWLLDQQYTEVHPFTNTPPGGWAWTDLTGGVPDADDTPGAMLALKTLSDENSRERCLKAAKESAIWLLDLQNNDGGIPTFCKGWGALPFDRSSTDLTAHTLRAWAIWKDDFPEDLNRRIESATKKGIQFLRNQQQRDGSWIPLWFGNQFRKRDEANPTYGTAMVCRALEIFPECESMWSEGLNWLNQNQNDDGGWGSGEKSPSSIEETALALIALAPEDSFSDEKNRGIIWLRENTKNGTDFPASPIGFYFAKLWYFERIYPVVWTVEALNRLS